MKVLIVDDEEIKRVSLVDDLTDAGHGAVAVAGGAQALARLAETSFDAVVTDLRMPGIDGLELLKRIRASDGSRPEVILMTAYGSIPVAVEAMKIGAFDFLTKPFRNDAILPLLARIDQARRAPEAAGTAAATDRIEAAVIGSSPVMREVRKMIDVCARTDATVLLTGETGTGKDLVASTIHELSGRRAGPFVKVSCAVFPQHLIERELYGHEKGAFTGADQRTQGKLDVAQGGTLYLDDVDDIPLEQQIKLLRVIEEKVFEPLGSTELVAADVRVIASTKVNLLSGIEAGEFRSDLYYRLNVLRIDLPPLREYLQDLPALADHLLQRIAAGRDYVLAPEAIRRLGDHSWPGNVRELAHALERALLISDGTISPELFAGEMSAYQGPAGGGAGSFKDAIHQAERDLLARALGKSSGNKSAAARSLRMKLSTFRDKLARHGLS